MKFKGQGNIWDAENNCILCRFKKGELETDDRRVIDMLISAGYEHDGELENKGVEPTIKQLKAMLEEKGIEYDPKAKKEELIKLLEGAE